MADAHMEQASPEGETYLSTGKFVRILEGVFNFFLHFLFVFTYVLANEAFWDGQQTWIAKEARTSLAGRLRIEGTTDIFDFFLYPGTQEEETQGTEAVTEDSNNNDPQQPHFPREWVGRSSSMLLYYKTLTFPFWVLSL